MGEKNTFYYDKLPFRAGMIVGILMIIGGIILICLGNDDRNDIVTALYAGEGIIISVIGIIVLCFFDAKSQELKVSHYITKQNDEIISLLNDLKIQNGATMQSIPSTGDADELPPL